MAHQQTLDLDYLRGEAQGIHKTVQAAMKVAGAAARVELFKKSMSDARQLQAKIKEAAAADHAERKHHLLEAAAQLAVLAALYDGVELKRKDDEMLEAARNAVEHITEAIASTRGHTANSSAHN